jgi:transcriptional regulator with XRE-family HTH domain
MNAQTTQTTETAVAYSALVAAAIRAEAARRAVTQQRLAALLELSQQAVSDRWRERTPWTFDDVQRVEEVLGMTPGSLLTELVRHQGLEPRTRWFGASTPVVDLAAERARRRPALEDRSAVVA